MLTRTPTLTREDPTVFARCSGRCGRKGKGTILGTRPGASSYYGRAFTTRKWAKGPVCENCKSPMVEVHRVAVDD